MHNLNSLLEGAVNLPSLPGVAIKLLHTIKKENLSIHELSDVISYDPALAARVLRMSNSSFYSLPYRVDTIDKAISVLGIDVLKNITLSFALIKGMRKDKTEGFDYEFFWRRSITAAVSAEMIASKLGGGYRESFVTALLMDIGVLIMYMSSPDDYLRVIDEKRVSGSSITDVERKVFHFDHQDVGSAMLEKWGIPENIYTAIRSHHKQDKIVPDQLQVIKILQLADLTSSVYHGSRNVEKLNHLKFLFEEQFDTSGEEFDIYLDSVAEKTIEVLSFFDISQGSMKPFSQVMLEANEELQKLNFSYEHVVMELHQTRKRIESYAMELKKTNSRLRELAYRDGLTGLYNHRYFQESMDKEIERAKRYMYELSLIMLDIDDFKSINDAYGHPQGDEILRYVSLSLQKSIRACDILARYGGEEFSILLPETNMKGAAILAERLRLGVEGDSINLDGNPITVTVSLGATTFEPLKTTDNKSVIIDAADKALYNSKRQGKNKISVVSMIQEN